MKNIFPHPWWRAELDRVNTGPASNKGHQNNFGRPNAAQLYFYWLCLCFCYILKHPERPVCVPALTATQSSGDKQDQICFMAPLIQSKSSYFCPAWCRLLGHVEVSFGLESFCPEAICMLHQQETAQQRKFFIKFCPVLFNTWKHLSIKLYSITKSWYNS